MALMTIVTITRSLLVVSSTTPTSLSPNSSHLVTLPLPVPLPNPLPLLAIPPMVSSVDDVTNHTLSVMPLLGNTIFVPPQQNHHMITQAHGELLPLQRFTINRHPSAFIITLIQWNLGPFLLLERTHGGLLL